MLIVAIDVIFNRGWNQINKWPDRNITNAKQHDWNIESFDSGTEMLRNSWWRIGNQFINRTTQMWRGWIYWDIILLFIYFVYASIIYNRVINEIQFELDDSFLPVEQLRIFQLMPLSLSEFHLMSKIIKHHIRIKYGSFHHHSSFDHSYPL